MDELHKRGLALENLFFKAKDAQLLEQLRAGLAKEENRSALQSASGITDAATLDALLELDISSESMISVALIPLVAVAWSDGVIQEKERKAILGAAVGAGISNGSPSYQILESWLEEKPGDDLLEGWKSYVSALKTTLDEAAFSQLKYSVINRAKMVAESAGGLLGIGNRVSDSEKVVITELESAF